MPTGSTPMPVPPAAPAGSRAARKGEHFQVWILPACMEKMLQTLPLPQETSHCLPATPPWETTRQILSKFLWEPI